VKLLSTRARAQLWKLQDAVRQASQERQKILKVLMNASEALALEARRELWLEFACLDQEYRHAVTQLGQFVEKHGSATGDGDSGLEGNAT
jgi:hypothetical protein